MDALELKSLRAQIDELNFQLLDLLSRRGERVCRIGELASRGQAPGGHDEDRERLMLEGLCAKNPGPYSDEDIQAIFRVIFERSLALKQRR